MGPTTMDVTFPASYIEWESEYPQDTTWWTFTADGRVYAAYKRKITMVNGAPPWIPHCLGYDQYNNCVPRINSSGDIIGTDGRTHEEYLEFWAAQIAGFLPIEYYVGSWGSEDGMRLTIGINRVIPGSYGGIACDMKNPTYVTSQWDPAYIQYDFWTTDSLFGYHVDDEGYPVKSTHGSPETVFSGWHGKHLYDKTNPIFKQL
ncbi:hypothetical protein LDC_0872 [sediment metagenome]|uniref:Uncharacterized protein n=1 Tax=sediment metagenome TaxID=749907 RepID=D9PH72_9ZZZZ